MSTLQTSYSDTVPASYAGMVANGETSNRISRTVENSGGIGFGKVAYRGSGDHGCIATQSLAGTSAALGTNTGNGAMGAITVAAPAKVGNYTLTIVEPGANVGTFIVLDPDGIQIGDGAVASAFSAGGLSFTLADGATDFVAGDSFTIAVAGNPALGITIATSALALVSGQTADKYQQYDTVNIMTAGAIWVTAGGTVADGDAVQFDSNGDFVSSGGTPLAGWVFDTSGVDDDLVRIVKR